MFFETFTSQSCFRILVALETIRAKNYNASMQGNLIEEFVNKRSLKALKTLLDCDSTEKAESSALQLSRHFGDIALFKKIVDKTTGGEQKLISSFKKNLVLLIQKTWVEKSDEELKAQVIYQLEEFCANLASSSYVEAYPQFFSIVDNVVYLMFGSQAKAKDFPEYALRIDPEFGIFWWYVESLPRETSDGAKARICVLLGMYFLANY